jgi:uncharacterized protein (DUF2147 family)
MSKYHLLCTFIAAALIVLSPNPGRAQAIVENDVLGDWEFPENKSVIRTYRCVKALCIKIIKIADPSRRDAFNPDPALRSRPLVGLVIASTFQKKGPTTWRGKLYSTLDGGTYEGTLNLLDKNRFTVVGCLFGNLLCDARTFYRVGTQDGEGSPQTAANSAGPSEETLKVTPPTPSRKLVAVARDPSRAEFDAFLDSQKQGGMTRLTEAERAVLFNDFLEWRKKSER